MAVDELISLKHKDVTVTVSSGSQFAGVNSNIPYSRIVGAMLVYTDDVYYMPPVMGIGTNNAVNIKLSGATSSARTYTVRIFYR